MVVRLEDGELQVVMSNIYSVAVVGYRLRSERTEKEDAWWL